MQVVDARLRDNGSLVVEAVVIAATVVVFVDDVIVVVVVASAAVVVAFVAGDVLVDVVVAITVYLRCCYFC